jgi:hypothetical protein
MIFALPVMYESLARHSLDLLLLARTIAGLVLIFASVPKLTSLGKFAQIVQEYRVLPEKVAGVLGRILPLIELACGFALLFGISKPWPGVVAIVLFALFAGAISINLLRGRRYIQCGCFGVGRGAHLSWSSVLRNAILAGLAFVSAGTTSTNVLSVGEAITITISGAGIVALLWLYGAVRKLVALPGRETP